MLHAYIPWRERAYLSIDETAEILARSPDWVRWRLCAGLLVGVRLKKGGPLIVTVPSVLAFIENVEAEDPKAISPPVRKLHLVVTNP